MRIFEFLRIKLTDNIAYYIATWRFVLFYTCAMILWIILHKFGILSLDSEDFIKYNLFLSWAAGIQASVVLMATNRQTEKDRKTLLKGIELDKETQEDVQKVCLKINKLNLKLEKLQDIIEMMEYEEEDILNGKQEKS